MSPLFFASMAPLLATEPFLIAESDLPRVRPDTHDRVSILAQNGDRLPSELRSPNIAAPEHLEQRPDLVATSAQAQGSSSQGGTLSASSGREPSESHQSARYEPIRYEVQRGDTLWDLSQRFNVPLQALLDANSGIVPEKLPVGYGLTIPSVSRTDSQTTGAQQSSISTGTPRSARTDSDPDATRQELVPYTVQRGDTVWAIAQRFDMTTQSILDANPDVVPERLEIGQSIIVPMPLESGGSIDTRAIAEPEPFAQVESAPAEAPLPSSPEQTGQPSTADATPNAASDADADSRVGTELYIDSDFTLDPWRILTAPGEIWKLGAIALFGLGLTVAGWYGWQKRADLQMTLNHIEQAIQPSQPQPVGLLPPDPHESAESRGVADSDAIATDQTPLSPQLSLRLASIFGRLATQVAVLSSSSSSTLQTSTPAPSARGQAVPHPFTHWPRSSQTRSSPPPTEAKSEVVTFRTGTPQTVPNPTPNPGFSPVPKTDDLEDEDVETWSTPLQHVLDQPPSTLPQRLIVGGIAFCLLFGTWAWVGTIEEVGHAEGQLVPQGEVYEVQFPDVGRVIRVAVAEGQTVKAGQILFELDTEVAASEIERLQDLLATYELELAEKQRLIPKLRQESEALALITQTNLNAQTSAISRVQATATTRASLINQLEADATAQQERLNRISPLVEEGALSREYLFQAEQTLRERQRSVIENQGTIRESRSQIRQLQAELEQVRAEGQRQQIGIQQQLQQLQTEAVELQARIVDTRNLLNQATIELNQRYLHAPVDGIVSSLEVVNAGTVVQPGEAIAEIIPDGVPLVLSAVLPSEEAGFVKTGMPVQIKFDAYPFQDFGVVPGTVQSIAPDTENHEQLGAVYRVEISLDQDHLQTSTRDIQFKPGSTASAEIVIRQRRIADILLDPIKQLQNGGLNL